MRFEINNQDCITRDKTIPESQIKDLVTLILSLIAKGMNFQPSPKPTGNPHADDELCYFMLNKQKISGDRGDPELKTALQDACKQFNVEQPEFLKNNSGMRFR